MKKIVLILFVSCAAFISMAFVANKANDPWPVPDKYVKMANPVKSDATSVAKGKELYTQHCQSCHGKKGKGDGPKSAQLDTESGDFTKADFQKQPDGSIFYKTSEGRKDMPSYKKKIPEADDIWAVVNYLRTLK
jgi:mono/diheme cytochrome c family protein